MSAQQPSRHQERLPRTLLVMMNCSSETIHNNDWSIWWSVGYWMAWAGTPSYLFVFGDLLLELEDLLAEGGDCAAAAVLVKHDAVLDVTGAVGVLQRVQRLHEIAVRWRAARYHQRPTIPFGVPFVSIKRVSYSVNYSCNLTLPTSASNQNNCSVDRSIKSSPNSLNQQNVESYH